MYLTWLRNLCRQKKNKAPRETTWQEEQKIKSLWEGEVHAELDRRGQFVLWGGIHWTPAVLYLAKENEVESKTVSKVHAE